MNKSMNAVLDRRTVLAAPGAATAALVIGDRLVGLRELADF